MALKLILLILSSIVSNVSASKCSMFGRCDLGSDTWKSCHRESEPEQVWNVHLRMDTDHKFINLCPRHSLFSPLCCDYVQLENLVTFLDGEIKEIFGHCPSCYANIANLFCSITCDPKQSDFLTGVRELRYDRFYNQLNVFAMKEYVEKLYDSCKHVKRPETMKGFGPICEDCNGVEFFQSLIRNYPLNNNRTFGHVKDGAGEAANETERKPLSLDVTPCDQVTENQNSACDCADCPRACESETTTISPGSDDEITALPGVRVETTASPADRVEKTAPSDERIETTVPPSGNEDNDDLDDRDDDENDGSGSLNRTNSCYTIILLSFFLSLISQV